MSTLLMGTSTTNYQMVELTKDKKIIDELLSAVEKKRQGKH